MTQLNNITKHILKTIATLIVCNLLFACQNGASLFSGNYSYKTSGNTSVKLNDTNNPIAIKMDEIGQMDIKALNKNHNDSIIIIKNKLGGDINILTAFAKGDSFWIRPYNIEYDLTISSTTYKAEVVVNGIGEMYDDIIVLTETYNGVITKNDEIKGNISSDAITTVAKSNK